MSNTEKEIKQLEDMIATISEGPRNRETVRLKAELAEVLKQYQNKKSALERKTTALATDEANLKVFQETAEQLEQSLEKLSKVGNIDGGQIQCDDIETLLKRRAEQKALIIIINLFTVLFFKFS